MDRFTINTDRPRFQERPKEEILDHNKVKADRFLAAKRKAAEDKLEAIKQLKEWGLA